MTDNDLLEYIFDRLGRSGMAEESFGVDEIEDWPSGALETLIKNNLLQLSQPSQNVECSGCEEYCQMPVEIFPGEDNKPARAFIFCDKPANLGRIVVELDKLKQWKITNGLLAKKLSEMLAFNKTPKGTDKSKRWVLGILKGKEHKGQVVLLVDENSLLLKVATHTIPLAEVLTLNNGKLTLDKGELFRLVNKSSTSGVSSYKPSKIRQASKKIDTQKRYEAWQKAYRAWKLKRPNMSDIWYSQQIEKSDIAYNRKSETIRRNMKK